MEQVLVKCLYMGSFTNTGALQVFSWGYFSSGKLQWKHIVDILMSAVELCNGFWWILRHHLQQTSSGIWNKPCAVHTRYVAAVIFSNAS